MNKKKKIQKNGKNGNKPKRRNSKTLSKRSRSLTNKTISSGMILINKSKPIGNKSTMLTGSNGKWKSKTEKSMKFKEKRRDKCTSKSKRSTKSKSNFKSTLDKLNSVTFWSNIFKTWKLTGIKITMPIKLKLKKKLTSAPN